MAICEYVEECYPSPPLIGSSPAERAEVRMWARRIDLNINEPMANGFRYSEGLSFFESRIHCLPEAANGLKQIARENLELVERSIGQREFICGARFSLADIVLFSTLRFFSKQGQPVDRKLVKLNGWLERVGARPSARA
jgi:glutathione S-transferase